MDGAGANSFKDSEMFHYSMQASRCSLLRWHERDLWDKLFPMGVIHKVSGDAWVSSEAGSMRNGSIYLNALFLDMLRVFLCHLTLILELLPVHVWPA